MEPVRVPQTPSAIAALQAGEDFNGLPAVGAEASVDFASLDAVLAWIGTAGRMDPVSR